MSGAFFRVVISGIYILQNTMVGGGGGSVGEREKIDRKGGGWAEGEESGEVDE